MEKLETLLNHLEFKFDVISLTETCNTETKNHTCNPKVLEGYQNYLGITRPTAKGGCGFYLNENINFIERKDLNFKIKQDEEYESVWVELLNARKPNTMV